ncbi:MAG: hypothetical protein ACI9V8_002300 [Urechidicola sp.]|jgi:hypothetical protein
MIHEANCILLPLFTNIRLGKVSHNSHFIVSILTDQLDDLTHRKTIMASKDSPDTERHKLVRHPTVYSGMNSSAFFRIFVILRNN